MYPFFGTRRVQGTFCDILCSRGCLAIIAIFVMLMAVCYGRPAVGNQSVISESIVFLSRYGYLPTSDLHSESLRTEDQLRAALSSMQDFAGLPQTGLADEATVRLMRRRRCGVPDLMPGQPRRRVRRYAIQGQKWPSTTLTWSVRSMDSSDDSMVRSQLRRAFLVWSDSSPLTFKEVVGGTADILVSFLRGHHGDGYPFDGEGAVLAHAFFPGEGIGGDAHFDAEERWLPNQPDDEEEGVNLFAVAAHEIGHSLGLSHSSTPGSLMFPYYQVMGEHFSLPQDDADGIRYLYGVKEPDRQSTMPPLLPKTTTQTVTTETSSGASVITTERSWVPKTTKGTKKPNLPPAQDIPDVCNTSIDAISVIRSEVFVFKGKYFWRLDKNHTLRAGYPVSIDRFWFDLPANLTHVDAVYERPTDTKIVFFVGRFFWLFSANKLESGYPKPLTDLGLPEDLERVDAAMVWGHNGKTYFFAGRQYWKFDEVEGRVELDYPRSIHAWRGVPEGVDAALLWTDGNTYFFKETNFWRFVDAKMRVENKPPAEIGVFWFKCFTQKVETTQPVTTPKPVIFQAEKENNAVILKRPSLCILMAALLLIMYRPQ
ncbi:matrix metalloproteinase-2-like [Uloborus diversus]|uniref:matrix metalloproteinase-2-like n=1 Tax=Uloborus diversus TaxID=327109 RepID=UPI00240A8181|nr:matrix metalloproteinase-2-like [Uloborus diversus]